MIHVLFVLVLLIGGCSLDIGISRSRSTIDGNLEAQTETPSLIAGEKVTTSSGAEITATFGEISQKIVLDNGVEIDGIFYQ